MNLPLLPRAAALLGLSLLCLPLRAVTPAVPGLPANATVIETRALPAEAKPDRMLVLWMVRPKKVPRNPADIYSCPERTRGHHYRGPARVSLVDTKAGKVLNTITLRMPFEEADTYDVPYRLCGDCYYRVEGAQGEGQEARPTLLWLRDVNGDGKALEFPLFSAEACEGLETSLLGYSERQDRLIQYEVELVEGPAGKTETRSQVWVESLYFRKPVAPGRWRYEIDWRGRGGMRDQYDVRYDAQAERFRGRLISRP